MYRVGLVWWVSRFSNNKYDHHKHGSPHLGHGGGFDYNDYTCDARGGLASQHPSNLTSNRYFSVRVTRFTATQKNGQREKTGTRSYRSYPFEASSTMRVLSSQPKLGKNSKRNEEITNHILKFGAANL